MGVALIPPLLAAIGASSSTELDESALSEMQNIVVEVSFVNPICCLARRLSSADAPMPARVPKPPMSAAAVVAGYQDL